MRREQLMVYFVFTYFCEAVYNGNPCGKRKLAAAAVLSEFPVKCSELLKFLRLGIDNIRN